jgi:methyl-accepting chemotaxis protein
MDGVTQSNAAMVEESTAASHSLLQEAESLNALLSQFSVGTHNAPQRAAPPPSPRRVDTAVWRPSASPSVRGAAARKLAPEPSTEGWEEF